ncbi:MAG: universal stress protein [Myxococcota bacterium]
MDTTQHEPPVRKDPAIRDTRETEARTAALQLLAAVTFDESGERALRQTFAVAKGHPSACVHVVHVAEGAGSSLERQDEALRVLPKKLEGFIAEVAASVGYDVERAPVWTHVRLGSRLDTIRQVARDYETDLIVVGTRGRKGLKKALLGSVAEELLRDGRFPVLLAHENRIREIPATVFPDEPRAVEDGRERYEPRIYRSSLIDGWRGFGRPTNPFG